MAEYTINAIAEFESLYDIDFGIIRLIRNKFNLKTQNGDYKLDQTILNADNYFLRCCLYMAIEKKIPELLAGEGGDVDFATDIYEQISSDEVYYYEALKLSPPTNIANLISMYLKTDGIITVTVLCKNETQKKYLKINGPPTRIVVGGYNIRISQYDAIFINYFADILKYYNNTKFGGKDIYVPTYRFNMDIEYPQRPSLEVSVLINGTNKIKTICPYHNFELPADEQEEETK